jgi:hypothetical protein
MTAVWHLSSLPNRTRGDTSTMINYQFGVGAYGAAVRPPPRRCTQSARRFSPTWLLRADFGPIAGRQKFDTQLRRATSG